jgi:hypothetical protein
MAGERKEGGDRFLGGGKRSPPVSAGNFQKGEGSSGWGRSGPHVRDPLLDWVGCLSATYLNMK